MRLCVVMNCKNYAGIRKDGLCDHHHRRFLKNGVIDDLRAMSFEERLWSWIDQRGPDECWPWQMRSRTAGYGCIGAGPKRNKVLAHRAVWESVNGPIPASDAYHGTVVMHLCDNRLCCNPAHLRLGTQADNVRDMREKGRNVDLPIRKGTDHPRAKINPEIVRAIRDRSNTVKRLNELYGVNKAMVDNVRRGRTWSHVP